ncbi:MAG: AAA family ATPase [Bacteroidetes bacterium]|nr:AAA family ATPase [Bacteroidota bacterium]
MLTRLKVKGFKSLADVDVRFGPFTCIAGANAVGKSNLFDAIRFLSALADRSLIEAARSVRSASGRGGDIQGLFQRRGTSYGSQMSFEADMIVPREGEDDLGQRAEAASMFLRYTLKLEYRTNGHYQDKLEILEESLTHIKRREVEGALGFYAATSWLKSLKLSTRKSPFITTEGDGTHREIWIHQDGRQGRTFRYKAAELPRTVLSTADATERPTMLLARLEMRSWRLLQLEPSAMREPDSFISDRRLGADGSHLAATFQRLAGSNLPGDVHVQVANRVSELIGDISSVDVDVDNSRQSLSLIVRDRSGVAYHARSLSDGTLRFIALVILELDPEEDGVICLEEPENGIHPARIPAMLKLLNDIALYLIEPIGPDNPLRQIIINTHSPSIVAQVFDRDLLVTELKDAFDGTNRYKQTVFSCLPNTWRAKGAMPMPLVPRGQLLAYLNPTGYSIQEDDDELVDSTSAPLGEPAVRVVDRADLQMFVAVPRTEA